MSNKAKEIGVDLSSDGSIDIAEFMALLNVKSRDTFRLMRKRKTNDGELIIPPPDLDATYPIWFKSSVRNHRPLRGLIS